MTTRSTTEKSHLRGLYYAAQLGSKAAAQKVKETISSLRVGPRRKPATRPAPRKAAPAPRKATAAPKPAPSLELDNGCRLVAAQRFVRDAMKASAAALNKYRNAPGAVGQLAAAVNNLPAVPTANHTLREWRHFTSRIEAARPRIEKLMQAIR